MFYYIGIMDENAIIIASTSTEYGNNTYITHFTFFSPISNEAKILSIPHNTPTLTRPVKEFIISYILQVIGLECI